MKRLIGFNLIFFKVLLLSAQSLLVTGNTSISTIDPCLQSHSSLTVKNVSANTLNILCEKIIVDTASGTDNFFCWGANCYGSSTYISTSSNELLPGEGDAVDFGGYYDAYCSSASATIEYCFFPESDVNDRTCITITYNEPTTSVEDLNFNLISEFYPNPTKGTVSFDYLSNKPAQLIIIDILGNQVKAIELTEGNNKRINISDLSNGVYFGSLVLNNQIVTVKKIVVR